MTAFLMSLSFIFLAELGDKSMLLAMAFATKYSARSVLAGVLCATALNHFLVVALGSYVTDVVSGDTIALVCSAAFIIFGLWTFRGDTITEEDMGTAKATPFFTVMTAFFISEMGDKTQLATLALAAEYKTLLPVWAGSTLGMVLADMVGIVAGLYLGKRIPENAIKCVCGSIFILTGLVGLYEVLPAFDGKLLMIMLLALVSFFAAYKCTKSCECSMKKQIL